MKDNQSLIEQLKNPYLNVDNIIKNIIADNIIGNFIEILKNLDLDCDNILINNCCVLINKLFSLDSSVLLKYLEKLLILNSQGDEQSIKYLLKIYLNLDLLNLEFQNEQLVLEILVGYLYNKDLDIQYYSLSIIGKIYIYIQRNRFMEFIKRFNGFISYLKSIILERNNKDTLKLQLKEKGIWVLTRLIEYNSKLVEILLNSDFFEKLKQLIDFEEKEENELKYSKFGSSGNDDTNQKVRYVHLICKCITSRRTPEDKFYFINLGFLKYLSNSFKYLSTEHDAIRSLLLLCECLILFGNGLRVEPTLKNINNINNNKNNNIDNINNINPIMIEFEKENNNSNNNNNNTNNNNNMYNSSPIIMMFYDENIFTNAKILLDKNSNQITPYHKHLLKCLLRIKK